MRILTCCLWILMIALGSPAVALAENFSAGASAAVKFGVHEIVLTGDGSVANPFDTIATVRFDEQNAKTVQAFFDGPNLSFVGRSFDHCPTARWEYMTVLK